MISKSNTQLVSQYVGVLYEIKIYMNRQTTVLLNINLIIDVLVVPSQVQFTSIISSIFCTKL